MTVFASVLTHRTVGLGELEQVALDPAEVPGILAELSELPELDEVAVLSTCNRTEIYASTEHVSAAARALAAPLASVCSLPATWFAERATVLEDEAAVRHLFRVTSGLDAMVPGEPDVQGQVRAAFRAAIDQRSARRELDGLFRGALEAGRSIRAASGLAAAGPSILRMGVEVVADLVGGLEGRRVAVVGAGRVARTVAKLLHAEGVSLVVMARRPETAARFADDFDARVVSSCGLTHTLDEVDAIVMATAAPHPLLRVEEARAAIARRSGRPLVVVDLGFPRNVDPSLSELQGIDVFDLERLAARSGPTVDSWAEALAHAEKLLEDEVARHLAAMRSRQADTVLTELHRRAAGVVDAEVDRACRRLPDVDDVLRQTIEAAVWRATRKVLHGPTVRLRSAAACGDDDVLETAAWLFGSTATRTVTPPEVSG